MTVNRTRIKVVKNKVASPFRAAEVDILYGEGISPESDLLDLGAEHGVVERSASWFSFAGARLGQGRETARVFLKEHPDVRQRIDAAVREKLGLTAIAAAAKAPAAAAVEAAAAKTA